MTCTVDVLTSITWLRPCLSGLSTVNSLLLSPFPRCTFWKEGTACSPHVKSEGFMYPLCEGGVATWIVWNPFTQIDLFSPIYLYQYGLVDIYFILQVESSTTLFILLLILFQLWPWEALSFGSCVPFTYSHHYWIWIFFSFSFSFKHILTFWHYKLF